MSSNTEAFHTQLISQFRTPDATNPAGLIIVYTLVLSYLNTLLFHALLLQTQDCKQMIQKDKNVFGEGVIINHTECLFL